MNVLRNIFIATADEIQWDYEATIRTRSAYKGASVRHPVTPQSKMAELLMNDEFKRVWKEIVIVCS
jgi:hypothetical protein